MTSLKRNFDNFVHDKKDGQKSQTQFKFQKLCTNHLTNNDHFQHQTLIDEIKMKNDLLINYDKRGNLSKQQNHITYCQKYAKILSRKYNLSPNSKSYSNSKQLKNVQTKSLKYLKQSEQICRIIISGRKYLQNSEIEYDNFYETLSLKLKQVYIIFQIGMKKNNQNDGMIEEQLKLMELFIHKFNQKTTKQYITPFTLFAQEFTKNTQKISKNSVLNDKKIIDNIRKHQTNIQNKEFLDSNYQTPNSPQPLSGLNEKNRDQSDLLISFKPNLSNSQNGFETLKYSQSELKINLSKQYNKGLKQIYNEEDAGQLPFSPVQPYRLHKLRTETANRTDKIKGQFSEPFFLNNSDQIKTTIQATTVKVKRRTKQQNKLAQNQIQTYSKSVRQISLTIESIQVLMSEEKFMMNNEWNQVMEYLDKDCKEMENLLQLGKSENELKDKRFLQNLDHVQNQLIEQIFSQRQCRKIEENVLTQLLTNLIDSLQQGTQ